MLQCPSCARPQEPSLICFYCGAPLGGSELDFFAALGIRRQLQLDLANLESAYHELGRRVHPDRFAAASSELRQASLGATALLTRAYRTLRDPVTRGLYWLELHGQRLAQDNSQVPPEMADLVFDVQEQLSELRTAFQDDQSKAREQAIEVTAKRAELQGLTDELYAELAEVFAQIDRADKPKEQENLHQLKAVLSKIAYMRTLLRDLSRTLDGAGQTD